MSTSLAQVEPLVLEGVEITVQRDVVCMKGVLSMRSPSETVTPFLRRIHLATIDAGLKNLTVDLTQLRFMNSSSIRSLVDWVEWIRKEPDAKRYRLTFLTKPDVTWQQTTLAAIRAFGGDHVAVQNSV
jgi:hypothetical protein